jgi:hypothetical protein
MDREVQVLSGAELPDPKWNVTASLRSEVESNGT